VIQYQFPFESRGLNDTVAVDVSFIDTAGVSVSVPQGLGLLLSGILEYIEREQCDSD
jgi:hypothetical protein